MNYLIKINSMLDIAIETRKASIGPGMDDWIQTSDLPD
jgi:hypothetical protein